MTNTNHELETLTLSKKEYRLVTKALQLAADYERSIADAYVGVSDATAANTLARADEMEELADRLINRLAAAS